MAAVGAALAPAGATLDLATADDASLAARAAELVSALRGADVKAQFFAAAEIQVWAAVERGNAKNPRAVTALLTADVLPALTWLQRPAAAARSTMASLCALRYLLSSCDDARKMLQPDTAVAAVVELLRLSTDAGQQREVQLHAAACIYLCTRETRCRDACCGKIQNFLPLLLQSVTLHVDGGRLVAASDMLLVLSLNFSYSAAGRECLWAERCMPFLVSLAARCSEAAVCTVIFQILSSLVGKSDDTLAAAHREGVYQACAVFLSSGSALAAKDYKYLTSGTLLIIKSLWQPSPLTGHIRHLLTMQPGALTGLLLGAINLVDDKVLANVGNMPAAVRHFFDRLRVLLDGAECWLLDSHHASFAILQLRTHPLLLQGATIDAFVQQWRSPLALHALTQPLPHQRVPAAVSLALLSADEPQFRALLAAGERLNTLIGALMQAVTGAAPEPQRCPLAWQTRAVRCALKSLVDTTSLAQHTAAVPHDAADDDDAPPAKRQRTGGFSFSAADVNVQRRDSTVLLISGRPFYVYGPLVEAKSAVLADALRDVTTLDPVAVPLPHDVPDSMQYSLFHAAMEHAYTGSVADVAAASLLPLWCIADCLQMDELRAWCVGRITPVLAADVALLEAAWATALARPSDALGDACAAAWLVHAAAEKDGEGNVLIQLLSRVHAGCAAKELPAAQLVRVLRAALQPAAAAAAEGA